MRGIGNPDSPGDFGVSEDALPLNQGELSGS